MPSRFPFGPDERLLDIGFTKRVASRQHRSITHKSAAIQSKMPFVTKTRHVGTAAILELEGRLTASEGSELRDAVEGLLAEGRLAILLDCARMRYIDSQGIAAFVRIWVSAGRGSKLKLFSLPPAVKEVLGITGLLKLMDTFEDAGAALQSLSQHS